VLSTTIEHGLAIKRDGYLVIPDFQRGLVWTLDQKIKFLESLVLGLPIGEYCLHENTDWTYDLLDGQQRWDAIFSFVDNQFPVFGLFFKDMNLLTSRHFKHIQFPHKLIKGLSYEQKEETYKRLAYGGTPHEKLNEQI